MTGPSLTGRTIAADLVHGIIAAAIGALVSLAGVTIALAPRVTRLEAQVVTLTKAVDQLVVMHLEAGRLVVPSRP